MMGSIMPTIIVCPTCEGFGTVMKEYLECYPDGNCVPVVIKVLCEDCNGRGQIKI